MKKIYPELNPVFITGTPRSGTSLLYRTLLKHSSFKPKNLCLEETRIFLHPFLAIKSSRQRESLFNYMLEDEPLYRQYLDSIRFEHFWQKSAQKLRLSKLFPDEDTFWKFSLNPGIIRKFFYHAKQVRNCKRIVEKTPKHLLCSDRIFTTFPQSKIIITLRHPIDVFSSYMKRKQFEPDSDWLDITSDQFIKRYRHMAGYVTKLRDHNRALLVKYEHFVKSPEDEFQNICSHIGEPFEQQPVVEDQPELNHLKDRSFISEPITQKTKQWSDYINANQAQYIESGLANEMDLFGYSSVLS